MLTTAPTPDPSADEAPLATGWADGDVALLDEFAQLSMRMARRMTQRMEDGESYLSNGDASKIALDFTRVGRALRLTLILKARARGFEDGRPAARPAPPATDDRAAHDEELYQLARAHRAQARLTFEHAITGRPDAEHDTLREVLEQRLEREFETEEDILNVRPDEVVARICEDLGLERRYRRVTNADGSYDAWVICRPDDDADTPLVWPLGGMLHRHFMEPRPVPPRRSAEERSFDPPQAAEGPSPGGIRARAPPDG